VERLAALAGRGPVLELGIGTGRLAIPLVERGIDVDGIDGSTAMVERLRAKPGADQIDVVIGDFATTGTGKTYSLVVLAVNTIFALPDQDAQVACFANAARHLRPGGAFVIEAWIPDVGAFRDNRLVRQRIFGDDVVSIETARLEPATQRMRTTQVVLRDGSVRLYPANHRYAWPAELDLMARLAGLFLDERWSDWTMSPFDDASRNHVSIYRSRQRAANTGSAGDGA
jgi:SAM-dependent methyltransferase